MSWLENSISKQRDFIEGLLLDPMGQLANDCAQNWGDTEGLDKAIKNFLENKQDHRCRLLYAVDKHGTQVSSNITDDQIDKTLVGQNLASRPYLDDIDIYENSALLLSDVYIDKQTRKPCITALYNIRLNDEVVGFIAADFGLNDLPLKNVNTIEPAHWRQIKGDPSIRSTMFQQTRSRSAMDEHLDEALDVVESLVTEQGIFHAKLHFSSSRATLWPFGDPYHYRLHVLDEIINPRVCLVYEKMPYPEQAVVPVEMVHNVLKAFKLLREADENIYLRAASLNIMNGLVGLNFSCDGSHYMPAVEFLNKDIRFWFGDNALCANQ
jgi:hypothetical protein